jgi:hypothetical protein
VIVALLFPSVITSIPRPRLIREIRADTSAAICHSGREVSWRFSDLPDVSSRPPRPPPRSARIICGMAVALVAALPLIRRRSQGGVRHGQYLQEGWRGGGQGCRQDR